MTTNNFNLPSTTFIDLYCDFEQLHESYHALWSFAGDEMDFNAGQCAIIVKMLNYRFAYLLSQLSQFESVLRSSDNSE